jgi:hypothetical protein
MEAIIIKADKKSSRIIKELATHLGADVTNLKKEQYEDIMLGHLMNLEKTGKTVSRKVILEKLK